MFTQKAEQKNSDESNWEKIGNFQWKTTYGCMSHHYKSVIFKNKKTNNEIHFNVVENDYCVVVNDKRIQVTLSAFKMTTEELDKISRICAEKKSIPFPIVRGNNFGDKSLTFKSNDPRIIYTFLKIVSQFETITLNDFNEIFKTLGLEIPPSPHLDMDSKDYQIHLLEKQISLLQADHDIDKQRPSTQLRIM